MSSRATERFSGVQIYYTVCGCVENCEKDRNIWWHASRSPSLHYECCDSRRSRQDGLFSEEPTYEGKAIQMHATICCSPFYNFRSSRGLFSKFEHQKMFLLRVKTHMYCWFCHRFLCLFYCCLLIITVDTVDVVFVGCLYYPL